MSSFLVTFDHWATNIAGFAAVLGLFIFILPFLALGACDSTFKSKPLRWVPRPYRMAANGAILVVITGVAVTMLCKPLGILHSLLPAAISHAKCKEVGDGERKAGSQVAILFIMELVSPTLAGNTYTPTALGKRAQSPQATPAPHTSTIIWGAAGVVFGIVTTWSQIATYLLSKEKWALEKPNLLAQIAQSKAQKAVTISSSLAVISRFTSPMETDITHLMKVANQDE